MDKGGLLMDLCVGRSNSPCCLFFDSFSTLRDPDQHLCICLGFVGFGCSIVGNIRSSVP